MSITQARYLWWTNSPRWSAPQPVDTTLGIGAIFLARDLGVVSEDNSAYHAGTERYANQADSASGIIIEVLLY